MACDFFGCRPASPDAGFPRPSRNTVSAPAVTGRIGALVLLLGWLCWLPTAALAAASPSQPGDSSAAAFGARQGPVDPLGTAILNVDSGQTFGDLQSAVDAASPGDTLQVQAPQHAEGQVNIDKDLTLEGQQGTEVLTMAVDTGSMGDDRAWFLVDAGVDLTVRNLAFDGDGRLIWQAFRHRGTGRFENCRFTDIQFNAGGPDFAGTAIVAFGGTVDVVDCRFEAIGRVGVLAFGTGVAGALFQGNTYQGKGDGSHLDYGLEIGSGATVSASDNHIHGNTGTTPDNSTSGAVLATTFFAAGTAADLQRNDFGDNTFAIIVGIDGTDTSTVSAAFNRLAGNVTAAVNHQSTVALPAENNWWGCNGGPGAAGCDGLAGSGTVTFDPWVVLQAAFDVDPAQVPAGDTALLQGFLLRDSNDGALMDTMAEGILMDFDGGPLGSVDPPVSGTVAGVATTTWTADDLPLMDVATVTLDNESIDVPVQVLPSADVIEVPALGGAGMVVLTVALCGAAVGWIRRRRPA